MEKSKEKKPVYKKIWVWVTLGIVIVVVAIISGILFSQPKKVNLEVTDYYKNDTGNPATNEKGGFGIEIEAPAGSVVKIIDKKRDLYWPDAKVGKKGKTTQIIHINKKNEFTNISLQVQTKHTYSDTVHIRNVKNNSSEAIAYRYLKSNTSSANSSSNTPTDALSSESISSENSDGTWTQANFDALVVGNPLNGVGGVSYDDVIAKYGNPTTSMDTQVAGLNLRSSTWMTNTASGSTAIINLTFAKQEDGTYLLNTKTAESLN